MAAAELVAIESEYALFIHLSKRKKITRLRVIPRPFAHFSPPLFLGDRANLINSGAY
jgi:hypothetical protein